MDKKELIREVLRNVRLCNGDVRYFIERGIKNRINDILKNFPYLLRDCEDKTEAIKFILNMLVPAKQKRQIYVDALKRTDLSQEVINSLSNEQLRAIAITFCDVTCDNPYLIDDLIGMI